MFSAWWLTIIFQKNGTLIVLIYNIISDSIAQILKKLLAQRVDGISWLTPEIYDLVELLVLSFCSLDDDIDNPFSTVSHTPVCLLILGCNTYDL